MTTREAVEGYVAAWNTADDTARQEILDQAWTDEGIYTDPTTHLEGRAALAAHIGAFHRRLPGGQFEVIGGPEEHHRLVRFTWRLTMAGAPPREGMDFGELTEDGRLRRIVGFFSPLPPQIR